MNVRCGPTRGSTGACGRALAWQEGAVTLSCHASGAQYENEQGTAMCCTTPKKACTHGLRDTPPLVAKRGGTVHSCRFGGGPRNRRFGRTRSDACKGSSSMDVSLALFTARASKDAARLSSSSVPRSYQESVGESTRGASTSASSWMRLFGVTLTTISR